MQYHKLTKYFGFYSESHYQWYEERERKEGFKGKRRGRERGMKPEAAKEAEEDKPKRRGKSKRVKAEISGQIQYCTCISPY